MNNPTVQPRTCEREEMFVYEIEYISSLCGYRHFDTGVVQSKSLGAAFMDVMKAYKSKVNYTVGVKIKRMKFVESCAKKGIKIRPIDGHIGPDDDIDVCLGDDETD